MKQFFRLVSMLAVAGLTFAYTSCTDYSEDINKTNSRVDELNNELATVKKQVENNKNSITALEEAKAKAEAAIAALEKSVSDLASKHDADVNTINETIKGLKGDVTTLTNRVKAIDDKLLSYATLEYVDATFATKDQMSQANEEIGKLGSRLTIAEGQITTLNEKYDSDLKITEIVAKITEAKTAADNAQQTASEALGKVNDLIDALGVYAEKGALEAKIAALVSADVDLANDIKNLDTTKLNISDFDKYFDEAIKKACTTPEGEVYKTVFVPLNDKISQVSQKLTAVENALNAKISALWGVFNTELRSLVFIPNLYVDGIEAVEYTYGAFNTTKFEKANGVVREGETYDGRQYAVQVEVETPGKVRVNPAVAVEYEMNPSSAVISAENALNVLTRGAESVNTRSDEAADYEASFVEIKNGNLTVNLKSNKTMDDGYHGRPSSDNENITVFALQATVRKGDKDTTVTSDYARIFETPLDIQAIAYNSKGIGHAENRCDDLLTNHLYKDAQAAIENTPELFVDYKSTYDIKKHLQTHYFIWSPTSSRVYGVYEHAYPKNDYGLSYRFELIDYCYYEGTYPGGGIFAENASESSFATIDPETGVLTPGVNGEAFSPATIDRQPLVRVTLVTEKGDIVAVGYIKVQILPKDYIKADPYELTADADNCENADLLLPDLSKVYAAVEVEEETEFEKVYALHHQDVEDEEHAIQYTLSNDNKFTQVAATDQLATITEKLDGKPTLEVVLDPAQKSKIYKMSGHTATIWVRYVFVRNAEVNPIEDEFEGIYVPITITITKNAAGTVGVKLSAYWFGDNNDKAILNVKVPNAEPGQPVPATWTTPIDQVWEGNAPRFTVGGNLAGGDYKYYFAPVQPTVGDVQLTVRESKIYDLYDEAEISITDNKQISEAEVALSADYTKGIYTNTELMAKGHVIARINQATGEITYENNAVAKELLNYSPSVPKEEAKLFANIGVVLNNTADRCDLVAGLKDAVNSYYFLRPLNISPISGKVYVDGVDAYREEANLNVFDVFEFSDWRGENGMFVTPDFRNLWYFKYYGISKFFVDVENVTTTLNNGELGKTKLSEKTNMIYLKHCTGDIKNPTEVPATGLDITYTSATAPTWDLAQYNGLKNKFGFIRYVNNGNNVSESFMLRIPVKVTYTWGDIETYVDVTVNKTL